MLLCSLSKPSYRPTGERGWRVCVCVCVCVCECVRGGCGKTEGKVLRDNRMQPRPRGGGGCDCAIITGIDLSVC